MATKAKRRKSAKPKFPRRRWQPGQQERVETPKKGKGSYRRGRRRTDEEIEDVLKREKPV
ncbi:MAG: hypothetical protein WBD63_05390 [Phycisphaerae bacterium]|nr:hypothetical protein [Phycisphaerae bacterium]